MKRITAVLGDYYHDGAVSGVALQQALRTWAGADDVSLRIVEAGRLAEALADKPDAVILFKEDRVAPNEDENARWMTAEVETAITGYVEAGGGWLAWHSGLASYEPSGAYVGMLRGHFLHHPNEHQPVRYEPSGDGSGFGAAEAFEIVDEHYFVSVETDRTDVFLRSASVDGDSIAGWRHAHGEGRVCCLTPAHRPEGLTHPSFLRLLGDAARWCANGV